METQSFALYRRYPEIAATRPTGEKLTLASGGTTTAVPSARAAIPAAKVFVGPLNVGLGVGNNCVGERLVPSDVSRAAKALARRRWTGRNGRCPETRKVL